MRRPVALITLVVVVLLVSATTSNAVQMDNPTYVRWAKFKTGAFTKFERKVTSGGKDVVSQVTWTLVQLSTDHLTLQQSVVIRGAPANANVPPMTVVYPARIDVSSPATATNALSMTAVSSGKSNEALVVSGRRFQCNLMVNSYSLPSGQFSAKTWLCEDVPGGLVKSETMVNGQQQYTETMTLVDTQATR